MSYPFGEHLREVLDGTLMVFLWGEDGWDAQQQADAFAAACALLDVTVLVRHSALESASVVFPACRPPTDEELGAAVAEVAFVSPRSSRLGGPSAARPGVPPALPPPFMLVQRRYAETFTLVRYRATRPVTLKRAVLARLAAPVVSAPTVLIQRAAPLRAP